MPLLRFVVGGVIRVQISSHLTMDLKSSPLLSVSTSFLKKPEIVSSSYFKISVYVFKCMNTNSTDDNPIKYVFNISGIKNMQSRINIYI